MNTLAIGINYQPQMRGAKTNIAHLNARGKNFIPKNNANNIKTDPLSAMIKENELVKQIYARLREGRITIDEAAVEIFKLMK